MEREPARGHRAWLPGVGADRLIGRPESGPGQSVARPEPVVSRTRVAARAVMPRCAPRDGGRRDVVLTVVIGSASRSPAARFIRTARRGISLAPRRLAAAWSCAVVRPVSSARRTSPESGARRARDSAAPIARSVRTVDQADRGNRALHRSRREAGAASVPQAAPSARGRAVLGSAGLGAMGAQSSNARFVRGRTPPAGRSCTPSTAVRNGSVQAKKDRRVTVSAPRWIPQPSATAVVSARPAPRSACVPVLTR